MKRKINAFHNVLKDCVNVVPDWGKTTSSKAEICFLLIFGEHCEKCSIGEISFGIKGGVLELDITNGEVDPTDIAFLKEFQSRTNVNASDEDKEVMSQTEKEGINLAGTVSVNPSAGLQLSSESTSSAEHEEKRSSGYTTYVYHIKANWHPQQPRWIFYPQLRNVYLDGLCSRSKFATVTVKDIPLIVNYRFVVKSKHILFTETPLIFNAATVNKSKVLHVLLSKAFLKLYPNFSDGSLEYGID